jgi:prepilin-type N-terminal cleavage/methylation domain-containing protein
MTTASQGYTLVELLVALAVTSIVLAGTYAAYTFFSQQQQALVAQTEVDRNALRAIDLMQSDIRMAGFKDYFDVNPMPATQPIVITNSAPGDIRLVYDDYDASGVLYRALIRYTLAPYTSSTGVTRNRLMREWRKCNNPATLCDLSNSTMLSGSAIGEPVLDWVTTFTLQGLNPKLTGSFTNQFQTIRTNLAINSPQKIESSNRMVNKNYIFLERAKNVSLVP